MRSTVAMLALGVACVACGSPGDTTGHCMAAPPCGYALSAQVSAPLADIDGATVTACWNDTCFAGVVPAGKDYVHIDGPRWFAEISFTGAGSGVALVATWTPWTGGDLHNGDTYKLDVTDAQGAPLFSHTGTITYGVARACGSSCPYLSQDLGAEDAGAD